MSLSFPRHILKRAFQLVALLVAGLGVAVLVGIYAENREHMPSERWLGQAIQCCSAFLSSATIERIGVGFRFG
jgi:hypothetical protein